MSQTAKESTSSAPTISRNEIVKLIAKQADTTPYKVNQIYNELTDDLIAPAIAGEEATITIIKNLIQDRSRPKRKLKIHEDKDNDDSPANRLRLALWFIGKIGDPDTAIATVQAAAKSIKSLA